MLMVYYSYISETEAIHARMMISPMSLKTFLELMPTVLQTSHTSASHWWSAVVMTHEGVFAKENEIDTTDMGQDHQ